MELRLHLSLPSQVRSACDRCCWAALGRAENRLAAVLCEDGIFACISEGLTQPHSISLRPACVIHIRMCEVPCCVPL